MARESARLVGEPTEVVLSGLPDTDWHLFHDVRWPGRPRAAIDHVAVGPQGVFVIDTLALEGDIDVSGTILRQGRRRRSKYVEDAVKAAEAVGGLLQGLPPEVALPVLCLLRPEPVFGWAGEVMVCSTENLVTMLAARPRLLEAQAVLHAVNALRGSLQSAGAPADPPLPLVAPARLGPAPRRRKRSRPSSEALVRRCLVAGVLAVLASTLVRLDLVPPLGEIKERGTQTVIDLRNPATPFGQTATLRQTPTRPSLEITAGAPVLTRSTTKSVRALPGNVLMAVPLTVRNGGGPGWNSFPGTTVLLRDAAGASYRPNPTITRVSSGKVLPAAIRLAPGGATRGLMVFEVPQGMDVGTLELVAGTEGSDTLRWKVD